VNFLGLTENGLAGTIGSQIGFFTSLTGRRRTCLVLDKKSGRTELYLDDNSLRGTLPSVIFTFTNLGGLSVAENFLVESTLPTTLGLLSELTFLTLFGSTGVPMFSGTIPTQCMRRGWLCKTHLSCRAVGLLKYLQVLDLSENELSGVDANSCIT
jgi:Leucine-rich repeat (LRR) protein